MVYMPTATSGKSQLHHTRPETSRRMAAVKQRDTPPEMAVRRALHAKGFRFRTHIGSLPGRPDIVFPRYRTVLMVHGCFWHHHKNCARAKIPNANRNFWHEKLVGNSNRDKLNASRLRRLGWRVLVVWECQLSRSSSRRTVLSLCKRIRKTNSKPFAAA